MPVITFLSDYGTQDEFVGVCKGVIARIAPGVVVIDITHEIGPGDVEEGALVLAQSVAYFPKSIHLAVVDPGVGSGRRALALGTRDGRIFVGPDNGLLLPAADGCGGAEWGRSIENPSVMLPNPSRTFHGRDVFSPAAALLATEGHPATLGPEVDVETLVRRSPASAEVEGDKVRARVERVDRFGNLQLNATLEDLAGAGLRFGDVADVSLETGADPATPAAADAASVRPRSFRAPIGETFSSVLHGELVLLEDSHRRASLARNGGSAAEHLRAARGTVVVLRRGSPR